MNQSACCVSIWSTKGNRGHGFPFEEDRWRWTANLRTFKAISQLQLLQRWTEVRQPPRSSASPVAWVPNPDPCRKESTESQITLRNWVVAPLLTMTFGVRTPVDPTPNHGSVRQTNMELDGSINAHHRNPAEPRRHPQVSVKTHALKLTCWLVVALPAKKVRLFPKSPSCVLSLAQIYTTLQFTPVLFCCWRIES